MEKAIPIETAAGLLQGRDCIYLDTVRQNALNDLIFKGTLNGALVKQADNTRQWLPYQLIFHGVLVYFSCELDTYQNLAGKDFLDGSCFDLIRESKWLRTLPVRNDYDKNDYHHYRLLTYDVVYDIIAQSYVLDIIGCEASEN